MTLENAIDAVRAGVFGYGGRLLDKLLFSHLFDGADADSVHAALAAYQNQDGGFGNGIEPDIQTPLSSGIATETALHTYALTGRLPDGVAGHVVGWLEESCRTHNGVPHPPTGYDRHPHQPWWKGPDPSRILAIVGLLHSMGVSMPSVVEDAASSAAQGVSIGDQLEEYEYPVYVYALHSPSFVRRDELLESLRTALPALVNRIPDHHLLTSRYWSFFTDYVDAEFARSEAERFLAGIDEDGLVHSFHPSLPWWHPIMTLDSLIASRRILGG